MTHDISQRSMTIRTQIYFFNIDPQNGNEWAGYHAATPVCKSEFKLKQEPNARSHLILPCALEDS